MKEKVHKRGRIDTVKGLKKENEMKYRVLFEGANDGIFLMKGGRFVDCNKKFLSIFACTKREVIGQTPYHFSPPYQPDGRPSKEKAIEKGKAAISGKPQRFEWRHIRSDGTPFDAEINLKRVKVGDNAYLLQAILRDISEQKETENRLRLSEEKYRSIFENAIEGMFQNTPDGRFLTVNPAIAKMHGYSSPEELMSSVTDIAAQLYADPADRERFKAILEKNGYIEGFETRFKRKDGGWAWFSINAKAVRGVDGHTIYYEGTVEDITERKRTEDALKASEERYRTFIDSASEGVFLKDSESRYLIVNRQLCTFVGRKEKDIIGSSDDMLLPPDIAKRGKEADLKTINTGSIMVYEETLKGRVYEIRKFPVNLKDNSRGIGGFIRDITESKRMEEDLKAKSLSLEEVNAALRVLLAQREQDKKDMEEKIINNVKTLVLPYIERIRAKRIDQETKTYLEILETNLQNIISPFLKRMMLAYAQFTPTEIHVANLIRQGMGIKEIARTLGVSQNAINHHRQSIRNKLGLNQMKVNLKTHLMTLI